MLPAQTAMAASSAEDPQRRRRGMTVNPVNPDATADMAVLLNEGRTAISVGSGMRSISSVLRTKGLAAFRAERRVFRKVDFAVAAGGALLPLGPNGSGKSTLLRLLAGLKRPDAGLITWDGQDISVDPGGHAARVAYIGHLDAVKQGLTAAENLAYDAQLGGGDAHAALATLGLSSLAALPARVLSAGQRRRLALVRLALTAAPLWLLDEPTVGLDAAAIDQFAVMLAAHRSRGGIVVAATHVTLPLPGAAVLHLG
jgi:heme exporter protein A